MNTTATGFVTNNVYGAKIVHTLLTFCRARRRFPNVISDFHARLLSDNAHYVARDLQFDGHNLPDGGLPTGYPTADSNKPGITFTLFQDKTRFLTYVVAAGLPYGAGEEIFHYFFKVAWHGETPALNIIGSGENIVPTIHVKDLSNIMVSVADAKPKTRYIVAVDDSMNSMTEIITVNKLHIPVKFDILFLIHRIS